MTKLDKLGRRIPEFDRSAAARKGAKTKKEKYGPDKHSRDGSLGARLGTRGYFGYLKAEDPEKLKELAQQGAKRSNKIQRTRKVQTVVRGHEAENTEDPTQRETPVSSRGKS